MRIPSSFRILALTGLLCLPAATAAAQAHDGPPDMAEFIRTMSSLMRGGDTNPAPLIDYKELRALLPEALDGMKRTRFNAEKAAAIGMSISFADATYVPEEGGSIRVQISDHSGLGDLANVAHQTWGLIELERESDSGFERTTRYGGHKARESYDSNERRGEVEILIGERLVVKTSGQDVTWEQIQTAVHAIDLETLASLKPKPAAE